MSCMEMNLLYMYQYRCAISMLFFFLWSRKPHEYSGCDHLTLGKFGLVCLFFLNFFCLLRLSSAVYPDNLFCVFWRSQTSNTYQLLVVKIQSQHVSLVLEDNMTAC